MNQRKKIFFYIAIFYTLYLVFPLLTDSISIPVWLPSILTSGIIIVLFPKTIQKPITKWFIAYATVLTIYVLIGKPLTIGIGTVEDNKKIFIELSYILPSICIFSVFYYIKDYDLTSKYVKWSVTILYLSFIVAAPLMLEYNSLREAYTEQGEDFMIPGLPGYSLMHSYTLSLPSLCYAVRFSKKKQRILYVIALLIMCYIVYSTYITTSLIIMTFILLFSFLYKENRTLFYGGVFLFIGLILYELFETGVFVDFIDSVYPFFENTPVEQKLNDFRASLVEGQLKGGSITGRQNLHLISWNSFFENPIWGTSVVGGHSSILDRFGGMGILGGFPFMMIIVTFVRQFIKTLSDSNARTFFIMGIFVGFLYLYEKGLWGAENWFMMIVFMPMTIWVLEQSITSKVVHPRNVE